MARHRFLRGGFALLLSVVVWLVGFSDGSGSGPVVPDTTTQFSLELDVIASADHGLIYAVEQRARPAYRIFSLNPRSGEVETVFTVPEDAIIFGIALNPARDTLAVSYATDFLLGGSGIWTLDLESDDFTEIVPAAADVFLTDMAWSSNGGSIYATHVDRRGDGEVLSISQTAVIDGSTDIMMNDAVNPIESDGTLFALAVGEDSARRSVRWVNESGDVGTVEVAEGQFDLDHLLAGADASSVRLAVLETDDGGLIIGEPAEAHGNHDVPSDWSAVAVQESADPVSLGLDPNTIVYDAAARGDSIVYATNVGLAIGTTERIDLIKSRAIRFVAA